MSDTGEPKRLNALSGCERFWSVAIAIGLIAVVIYSNGQPFHQTTLEFSSDGNWKQTDTPVDLTHLNIGAFALSAVLLLYAINGLRVVRFSAGSVAIDTTAEQDAKRTIDHVTSIDPAADQPVDPNVKLPESTATPATVQTAKGPFEYYKLSEVPAQVLQDTITKWPEDNIPPTDFTDFMFALRKTGRGNHPWIIKLRDRLPVVVSYGGQGKLEATVTKA